MELQGNAFVNPDTGNKFQIIGIDYQINGSAGYNPDNGYDALSVPQICLRDAALMQTLGVNAIRVYNLNPDLNHDECVSIFNAAGMYMLLDVNSPLVGESLSAWQPWTSYYEAYLNRTFAMVEAFKNYPNTLGFFSANEVIDKESTIVDVPPYLRAVTRDLRMYVRNHADRHIPVGYSAADVRDVLWDTWNYLQCEIEGDEEDMSRIELFGLNSYSWCGESDYVRSSFVNLTEGLKTTSVPVFFSEFGCNDIPADRPFTEIGEMYGKNMSGVFSGGLVYEYSQESHEYGLVQVYKNNTVQLLQDFVNLSEQYAMLDHDKLQSVKPDSDMPKPPKCKAGLVENDAFNSNYTLPDFPPGVEDLIKNGIKPKPSGKLVDISEWDVPYTVLDVNGNVIQGLAVKPLDGDINRPGTNTPSTSSSSAAPSATGTSESSESNEDEEDAGISLRPALAMALGLPLAILML